MNDFSYHNVPKRNNYGDSWLAVAWEVKINGKVLSGESETLRAAYHHARKAVRRYRKLWNELNPNEPRI